VTAVFARWGHPSAELIGQGMDGVVYRLGGGLVGKVWHRRTAGKLARLRAFYVELAAAGLPYATPEIVAIHSADGEVVTVERELPGTPLDTALATGTLDLATAYDVTVQAVTALASTSAGPATRALPVLDQPDQQSLATLVARRANDVLAAAVPGFADLLARVLVLLERRPPGDRIVHGDICPANLLVDAEGRLVSVLDWGFLTMAGDNTFDAATAAGFFDMYGPDARRHDDALTDRFAALGYDRGSMLLYRAAYAIAGATAYHADGSDGHFDWCAAVLRRGIE
jgi:aminoglycoside phosphotransferase (APT) family kinase protein